MKSFLRTTAGLFALLLTVFSAHRAMAADAFISVDLIDQRVGEVGVVGFEVAVPADANLAAFTIEMAIDPTVVTLNTFDTSSSSFSFTTCNAEGITLTCSGFNTAGFTDETVKLFDLPFTCLKTGAVPFGADDLSVSVFTDSNGVAVPYTFNNIAGIINCGESTAATVQDVETAERMSPLFVIVLVSVLLSAVVGYKTYKKS